MLRRVIGATCVAASLYLTLPYVPTRWNPAGDPTRDAVLRPVYGSLDLSVWRERGGSVSPFPELPKTRRFASLWVRMVLRLLGPTCLHLPDRSMFRQSSLMKSESRSHKAHQKDFNETMGYPGEGPLSLFLQFLFGFCAQICHPLSSMLSLSLSLDFCRGLLGVLFLRSLHRLWIFVGVLACAPAVQAMRLFPRTAGERTKAAIRMNKPPVPSGRPVLPVTMQRRTQLPNEFFMWATEQGPDIAALLEHHQRHIDDINLVV